MVVDMRRPGALDCVHPSTTAAWHLLGAVSKVPRGRLADPSSRADFPGGPNAQGGGALAIGAGRSFGHDWYAARRSCASPRLPSDCFLIGSPTKATPGTSALKCTTVSDVRQQPPATDLASSQLLLGSIAASFSASLVASSTLSLSSSCWSGGCSSCFPSKVLDAL